MQFSVLVCTTQKPSSMGLESSDLVEALSTDVNVPPEFVLPDDHRPVFSTEPDVENIPVVDLSGLSDENQRAATLEHLHKTCLDWGFFHVINHGIAPAVMEAMQRHVGEFLAQSVGERAPGGVIKGMAKQGYGTGFAVPETGARDWRDFLALKTYPESSRDYDSWPKSHAFREVIIDYTLQVKALGEKLLECCSINLGLHPTYLKEALGELHQLFLLNHYPPCPQPELAMGIHKHADVGALTCLWQWEDVIGLQVLRNEQWVPVRPIPGAFIVNVGNMVEILSNGIYKSIVHRGVVNSSRRRVSVGVFYDLHPDAVVEPAPALVSPDRPPQYLPTRFRDNVMKIVGKKPLA